MLSQLSYFRKNRPTRSHPFPTLRRGSRLIAPTLMHGRRICPTRFALWEEMDSNHRRRTPADLQSAPFGHSGIFPICFPMRRPLFTTLPLLCAPSFLPRPLSAPGLTSLCFIRPVARPHLAPLVFPSRGGFRPLGGFGLIFTVPQKNNSFGVLPFKEFASSNKFEHQILCRPPLSAVVFLRAAIVSSVPARLSSRWRDSNPRPADYKSAALAN